MVVLPADWRQFTGEALAREVISQVDLDLRDGFQRVWIRALLDLMLEIEWSRNETPLTIKPVKDLGWRINTLLYAFFAEVDDDALQRCLRANRRFGVFAIVPEGYKELFQNAVEASCKRRPPTVMTVTHFTGWRFLWAGCACKCGRDGIVHDFVRRFNRRVNQANDDRLRRLELEFP